MMNYTITLTQQQVMVLVQMLEQVHAPLAQTYPVWAAIKEQVQAQDLQNAIEVKGPV